MSDSINYEKIIEEYIKKNIGNVMKEPRAFIHYPFIDPGAVYDGNVWDWDTYWCVYALLKLADLFDEDFQKTIVEHSKGNVMNFLEHQLEDGYIPMMIEVGEWSEPYLNMRHKEGIIMNMHKPFLCAQIQLISEFIDDYTWVSPYVEQLETYFSCYDKYYYKADKELYVWADDIMIGMDNDPASFGRPKNSTANIYLNSFMVNELKAMNTILSNTEKESLTDYEKKADLLVEAIQRECWDKRDEFFYSVDVQIRTNYFDWFNKGLGVFWKTLPIKIMVWSGFLPMWACFATKEQGESLVSHYRNENQFHSEYGVTTLAKDEKMFNLEATNNPSNWLGGIWLVANYCVFKGLLQYGYKEDAAEICKNSLKLLGEDIQENGSMHEYYDPYSGKPVMNGGFINWNILALVMARECREMGIVI